MPSRGQPTRTARRGQQLYSTRSQLLFNRASSTRRNLLYSTDIQVSYRERGFFISFNLLHPLHLHHHPSPHPPHDRTNERRAVSPKQVVAKSLTLTSGPRCVRSGMKPRASCVHHPFHESSTAQSAKQRREIRFATTKENDRPSLTCFRCLTAHPCQPREGGRGRKQKLDFFCSC